MDCAGAVACCAKNGSNAGETDRSLIALGNPACPNNFAKRPAGEREAALPNRPGGLDAAIQRGGHPAERRNAGPPAAHRSVPDRVGLIPAPIQPLGIAGKKKLIK